MADFGFGAEIGRDEDANRWALATPDVVESPTYWVATPVAGQRAVSMSPGRGQAAQITMPGSSEAVTPQEQVELPFNGSMTHQGKLICRELLWYGNGSETDPLTGESKFTALNAGDFTSLPAAPPPINNDVQGFERVPGFRYLVPLWYAVVDQQSTNVRLWDLRVTDISASRVQLPTSRVLAGKVPAVGSQLIEHRDVVFASTNQNGDTSIVFPKPFPNGVISVQLRRVGFGAFGATSEIFNGPTQSLDRVNFRVFQTSGAALPNANLEYAYEAIGW